jgi:hypothetical protein
MSALTREYFLGIDKAGSGHGAIQGEPSANVGDDVVKSTYWLESHCFDLDTWSLVLFRVMSALAALTLRS